jgi:septum formation protein
MGEVVILASASPARAGMLKAAGIDFTVDPAEIDEAIAKQAARVAGLTPVDCALRLAEMKAMQVSARHRGALVIGADQILVAGPEWFDKPADIASARDQLVALRGRTHELATGACVVRDGSRLWQAQSRPALTMREFSDMFLDAYLAAEGEVVLGSVGAYRLEGRGIQLFSRIEGDHFAILGLPLVELLGFLRECGAVAA